MSNILISMLCYIINILLFKFAGIIHTLIIVFHLKDGKVDEYLMRTAENKVRPWIPYYIFGFTIFSAYFYMSTLLLLILFLLHHCGPLSLWYMILFFV